MTEIRHLNGGNYFVFADFFRIFLLHSIPKSMKTGRCGFFVHIILMSVLPAFLSVDVQAQNPIPSYDVLVNTQGTFTESFDGGAVTDGKRKVLITGTSTSESTSPVCHATVYVGSTDMQTILGPFALTCGVTLEVEIDDRQWGVLVNSDTAIIISVWIEEGQISDIVPQLFHPTDYDNLFNCNPLNESSFPIEGEQLVILFIQQNLFKIYNHEKCFPNLCCCFDHVFCHGG